MLAAARRSRSCSWASLSRLRVGSSHQDASSYALFSTSSSTHQDVKSAFRYCKEQVGEGRGLGGVDGVLNALLLDTLRPMPHAPSLHDITDDHHPLMVSRFKVHRYDHDAYLWCLLLPKDVQVWLLLERCSSACYCSGDPAAFASCRAHDYAKRVTHAGAPVAPAVIYSIASARWSNISFPMCCCAF